MTFSLSGLQVSRSLRGSSMAGTMSALCPYCSSAADQPIGNGLDESSTGSCPHCGMPHHVACWKANGGCTTFQCPHSPQASGFIAAALRNVHRVGGAKPGVVVRPQSPVPAAPTTWRSNRLKLLGGMFAAAVLVAVLWNRGRPLEPSPGPGPIPPTMLSIEMVNPSATITTAEQLADNPSQPTKSPQLIESTPRQAASAQTSPMARVTANVLNVRSGPGTGYAKVASLQNGASVQVIGRNGQWWQIAMPDGRKGWIHGDYVEVNGSTAGIAVVQAPPLPPSPTPAPVPTAKPATLASNRASFSGNQGEGGWTYLMEDGRNSGRFRPLPRFDGNCWRTDNWEGDVRICAEGEVHPGQSTRVAHQWRVTVGGQRRIEVHAHKIDTRCGDGVWVGTFKVVDDGSGPRKLGEFTIRGNDNRGNTVVYSDHFDAGNLVLVLVDIRGESTCDMTRLYIDVR